MSSRGGPPLKSSSSLDSSFGIGPSSLPAGYTSKRPQSPYSTHSDISHFLASTYGRNILKSPTTSGLADFLNKPKTSSNDSINKALNETSKMYPSNFSSEIKSIQQKIMDELKTSEQNNSSILKSVDQLIGNSGTGYSKYDSLADKLKRDLLTEGRLTNYDTLSETRVNSLGKMSYANAISKNSLPFKSYEYESLNPVRLEDNKYRLSRPLSSVSFYENDFGMKESQILNYMNQDDPFLDSGLVSIPRSNCCD